MAWGLEGALRERKPPRGHTQSHQLVTDRAQPTLSVLLPSVAADSGRPKKQLVGIVFVLDVQELLIVMSIECGLPIRIEGVALVEVGAAVVRDWFEARHVVVCDPRALLEDGFVGSVVVPRPTKVSALEPLWKGKNE